MPPVPFRNTKKKNSHQRVINHRHNHSSKKTGWALNKVLGVESLNNKESNHIRTAKNSLMQVSSLVAKEMPSPKNFTNNVNISIKLG